MRNSISSLPIPSLEAQQHSAVLVERIKQEILENNGWISFARYMELALHAPGLGYYSAGAAKFGQAGDFVTAPEISALFGQTLARQAAQILAHSGPHILELGAGSGRLAVDLLLELERLDALPQSYVILEISADLAYRQRQLVAEYAPQVLSRVTWAQDIPVEFSGLILANEVLDALPVHLVIWRDGKLLERGLTVKDNVLTWQEQALTDEKLRRHAQRLQIPDNYLSEISLAAPALVETLADHLKIGAVLLLDYGFAEAEYYHPQRNNGTLMCHYRHYAHDDPLYLPGLQDITSHVNFSAVAQAGIETGLSLLGYANQAQFLINCGITELLQRSYDAQEEQYQTLAAQAQRLLSPAEMGEMFKVIGLGENLPNEAWLGFARGSKDYQL